MFPQSHLKMYEGSCSQGGISPGTATWGSPGGNCWLLGPVNGHTCKTQKLEKTVILQFLGSRELCTLKKLDSRETGLQNAGKRITPELGQRTSSIVSLWPSLTKMNLVPLGKNLLFAGYSSLIMDQTRKNDLGVIDKLLTGIVPAKSQNCARC